MKIDGGCHCGSITFEAEVDPDSVAMCHCTDCQTLSGSAFRISVRAPEESFKLLTGKPRTYIKTAESGSKRAQVFCSGCGTHIYATSVGAGPKVLNLRVGTIRQRSELRPTTQRWFRSAQKWIMDLASIKQIEKQ